VKRSHVLASSSPPRGHELVSHAEQVPQDIGRDAGQANQHGGVVEIVVGHVVDIRVCCEQFSADVEVRSFSANGNRSGNNSCFRLNFLVFIGDFAYFLSLAERGGFEPPIPVLPG
jgi:hypothetical protein